MKVTFEYEETPNEKERLNAMSKIMAQGLYSHFKKNGLLRIDSKRHEKTQKILDETRKLLNRNIESREVDSSLLGPRGVIGVCHNGANH